MRGAVTGKCIPQGRAYVAAPDLKVLNRVALELVHEGSDTPIAKHQHNMRLPPRKLSAHVIPVFLSTECQDYLTLRLIFMICSGLVMVGMGIMGCMGTSRQVKPNGETKKMHRAASYTECYTNVLIERSLFMPLEMMSDHEFSKYTSSYPVTAPYTCIARNAAEYDLCSRRQLAGSEKSLHLSGVEIVYTF